MPKILFLILIIGNISDAWIHPLPQAPYSHFAGLGHTTTILTRHYMASRNYGPPLDDSGRIQGLNDNNANDNQAKAYKKQQEQAQMAEFRTLLQKVLDASKPEHIPSLLAKHTELLLRMEGPTVAQIVQDVLHETPPSDQPKVEEAIDMIVSFAEDFVDQSKQLDDSNKQLLGKIIRTMTQTAGTEREREEALDSLLAREKDQFTRGFLRHLEGECDRISSAPQLTKDSTRLLEILLTIKTRILEELGQDLGEGALVLGQLVAYDDKRERLAVLDAGLQVRGVEFAHELRSLTQEALQGLQAVPNGAADPTLVKRVEEIDARVKAFIENTSTFE